MPPRASRQRCRDRGTLITVKHVAAQRSLTVGVLNVRLLENKSSAVRAMIMDKSLDVLAVVESWHDVADSPSVIASTPKGYCVVAHHSYKHGRVMKVQKTATKAQIYFQRKRKCKVNKTATRYSRSVTASVSVKLNVSNDANSHKDLPFWLLVDIAAHLGGQIAPKVPIWGRE